MHLTDQTDKQLVSLYLKGNESAFEALIRRHQQRIYTQIYLLVKNDELANDIFQETFIKAIRTLKSGKYKEEGKFLPWIMRISHNLSIDTFRRAKKIQLSRSTNEFDVFATVSSTDPNIEEALVTSQIHCDVRKLVASLPDEQREVLNMRIYEGLSFKEIADKTEVSINTALGRMRYALINIRKLMEQNNVILTR